MPRHGDRRLRVPSVPATDLSLSRLSIPSPPASPSPAPEHYPAPDWNERDGTATVS